MTLFSATSVSGASSGIAPIRSGLTGGGMFTSPYTIAGTSSLNDSYSMMTSALPAPAAAALPNASTLTTDGLDEA